MLSINFKGMSKLLSLRNNTRTFAVAFIALLTLSAVVAILPAFAKTYTAVPDRETMTDVGTSPKLIGLGQEITINIITYPAPSGPTYYAQGGFQSSESIMGFNNTSVTFTKPDGTKDTFMPIDETLAQIDIKVPGQQQIVGSLQFRYKPDQVGNYSVTASFGGRTYTTDGPPIQHANLNLSVYYKPSSSAHARTFTVQEELVLNGILNGYPWSPYPTAYWTHPVSTDNREWAAIAGDWLQSGYDSYGSSYNPYSEAPDSGHIVWKKVTGLGGLPSGIWGSLPYGGGGGSTSIILGGYIYGSNTYNSSEFTKTDIRTGQVIWSMPGSVSRAKRTDPGHYAGQTNSQENQGAIAVELWGTSGTNWVRYNAFNGAVSQTITGAPSSGNNVWMDEQQGDLIVFLAITAGWNTTIPLKYASERLIKWNYSKVTGNNWATGVEWNVSVRQPDGVGVGDGRISFRCVPFPEAGIVMMRAHDDEQIAMGFDYNTGAYLWRNEKMVLDIGLGSESYGPNGPYVLIDGASNNFVAYNVKTGQEQWRASRGEQPWSMLPTMNSVTNLEKGVWYAGSFDGHLYAYDYATGKILWKSEYVGADDEVQFGNQPIYGGRIGADGKIFHSSQTVYQLMPRTRFGVLVCYDEADGSIVWKLPLRISPSSVAYGYLLGSDSENGMQYCIGKGKTETTVETQQVLGGMLIEGTVLDTSSAQPNTAAISDADMSEWMDYLHGQNATLINSPPTPDGVPVQLTAMGADGSVVDLGTVTSDSTGHYGYLWNSTDAGLYTIYATFAGSNSYYASYASGSGAVAKAQETSTNTGSAVTTNNSEVINYMIAAAVAIIIAIAIVGVLLLRKGKQ